MDVEEFSKYSFYLVIALNDSQKDVFFNRINEKYDPPNKNKHQTFTYAYEEPGQNKKY